MKTIGMRHGMTWRGVPSCAWLRLPTRSRIPLQPRAFTTGTAAGASGAQQAASRHPRRQLDWVSQHQAATIAAWSGLCYLHSKEELEARLAGRGISLVASGRNEFTSWYVADGTIDAASFAQQSLDRRGLSSSASSTTSSLSSVDEAAASQRRERFVLLRGVQWGAPDLDTTKMWRSLMRVWPKPLAPGLTRPEGSIVAHEGVGELALAMFDQLRPYLDQAEDAGIPVVFAGHSLGGALCKVLMALYRLSSRRPDNQPAPSCYTFGSPPVLAHVNGGGGDKVLDLLGLRREHCRNFILQNDPIPRAMLSVDPTYQLFSGLPIVQGLLEFRAWLAGHSGAPLSPKRFLFETVGEVHFIKWTPQDGSQVLLLEPDELAAELSMLSTLSTAPSPPTSGTSTPHATASMDGTTSSGSGSGSGGASAAAATTTAAALAAAAAARLSPLATVQAVLDHHHGSYAQELEAAASRELIRLVKEELQGQQQGSGAPPQQQQPQQGEEDVGAQQRHNASSPAVSAR